MTQRKILVCQNRTCRKQGSPSVLKAFKALDTGAFEVTGSGCLGQCGKGPMVLVLPDEVWYSAVPPTQVPMILQQHPDAIATI